MRAVVDTNILIRALIKPGGTVGQVLLRLRNGDFTLLYSSATLHAALAPCALSELRPL